MAGQPSSLTPEQLVMLMQRGFLDGGDLNVVEDGGSYGPLYAGGQFIEKDKRQIANVAAGVRMPLDDVGSLNAGVLASANMGGPFTVIRPNVGINLGPVQGRVSQSYVNGERVADTYSANLRALGLLLEYMRTQPVQGAPMDSLQAEIPVGDARLLTGVNLSPDAPPTYTAGFEAPGPMGSNVTMMAEGGEQAPATYTGGVVIPGLLGGDLTVGGQYTPEYDDGAAYLRYRLGL